ncbi:hypothetical protein SAICODRAFT_87826 [Saitoella complicata NRRL Y-17804]|uniref:uncharacterized protein n=1 Tax=Saitoella complicata (strain BCRC 22490 / CBS 7301 / JCM 7358 / NBRC 10748 / NRRL Y-17804) TaxID=698492 RepID=UPI000867DB9C|nr:uncharacterized protein SAICODRAFT_87826 [Saitoella complicata NRRL Y-17804]ODQ55704.1 hypothetical protein SAICODRAFT_87826 [Saitoella complicata NRRL Y-17804]
MLEQPPSCISASAQVNASNAVGNTPFQSQPPPALQPKVQAAFVNKLYAMVEEPTIQHLISWTTSGETFVVKEVTEFSKCLSHFFKHNNWQSFVRQLNMYGFHKVNDMFHQNSSTESTVWEFKHPNFKRGGVDALQGIKRKSSRQPLVHRDSYSHQNSNGSSALPTPVMELGGPGGYMDATVPDEQAARSDHTVQMLSERVAILEDNYNALLSQSHAVRSALQSYEQLQSGLIGFIAALTDAHKADGLLHRDVNELHMELEKFRHTVANITSDMSQRAYSQADIYRRRSTMYGWQPPERPSISDMSTISSTSSPQSYQRFHPHQRDSYTSSARPYLPPRSDSLQHMSYPGYSPFAGMPRPSPPHPLHRNSSGELRNLQQYRWREPSIVVPPNMPDSHDAQHVRIAAPLTQPRPPLTSEGPPPPLPDESEPGRSNSRGASIGSVHALLNPPQETPSVSGPADTEGYDQNRKRKRQSLGGDAGV